MDEKVINGMIREVSELFLLGVVKMCGNPTCKKNPHQSNLLILVLIFVLAFWKKLKILQVVWKSRN